MSRFQKLISLAVALVLISSFSLAGCSGSPTAQEITARTLAAGSQVQTYKFEMAMALNASGTFNNKPGTLNTALNGNGALDIANKQMQMMMNIDATVPGQGQQSIPLTFYRVGDWVYTRVSLPVLGEQWVKSKAEQSTLTWPDQSALQLEMLQSAVEVVLLGTEDVNGVSCYKMEAKPDLAKISSWLQSFSQTTDLSRLNLGDLDLSKWVKQLSITEWISKDSYWINKAEISLKLGVGSSISATPSQSNNQFSMDISETLRIYDHNKPVSITLPAEAQTAKEINLQGNK